MPPSFISFWQRHEDQIPLSAPLSTDADMSRHSGHEIKEGIPQLPIRQYENTTGIG